MGKLSYNRKLHMHMLWQVSHCLVYAERLSQRVRRDCRLVPWLSGRTLVFDQRAFAVLCSTYS